MQSGKEGSALVFWNCELDTLRSDLGLFGFPPKDVQYDFLSTFKPVFYLRQRDYSKTVNVAPYIINYSGCLFREFPGPWQIMLRQDSGEYACIAEDPTRCVFVLVYHALPQTLCHLHMCFGSEGYSVADIVGLVQCLQRYNTRCSYGTGGSRTDREITNIQGYFLGLT